MATPLELMPYRAVFAACGSRGDCRITTLAVAGSVALQQ